LEVFKKLEKLDPNHYTYGGYINWRTHVPDVYINLGDFRGAIDYMNKNHDCYEYNSSMCSWNWTKGLCDYVTGDERGFCKRYFQKDKFTKIDGGISAALWIAPVVMSFLNGSCALPDIPMPFSLEVTSIADGNSYSAQALYVTSVGHVWREQKGAIEWAQKNFNTFKAWQIVKNDDMGTLKSLGVTDPSYEEFAKALDAGVFYDARMTHNHTLLHLAVIRDDIRFVKLLLDKGMKVQTNMDFLTPAHLACYYDKDPKIVLLLMDNGADITNEGITGQSPIVMAANQGNWRIIEAIFRKMPNLPKNRNFMDVLLQNVFLSSVYECLHGGDKCQRCLSDKTTPHGSGVSFEKVLQIMFSHGYKPTLKEWRSIKGFYKYKGALENFVEGLMRGDIDPGRVEEKVNEKVEKKGAKKGDPKVEKKRREYD